jgi:hypothetical protein
MGIRMVLRILPASVYRQGISVTLGGSGRITDGQSVRTVLFPPS